MADVTLANGGLTSTVAIGTGNTRTNGQYTIVGSLIINASSTATVNNDVTCNRIIVNGGTSEGTRSTLTIGSLTDAGVCVKSTVDAAWTADGGAANTDGYSTLNIYNSILKVTGTGPGVGQYNPTQSQANVTMDFRNSEIYCYADNTFVTLGDGGEPMIAPNANLENVRFRGHSKIWLNGNLTDNSYGIDMVSFGTAGMGIATAAPVSVPTVRKASSDWYGTQQATTANRADMTLIDCQITSGLVANQSTTITRVFTLQRTVGARITNLPSYTLWVLDGANAVASQTSQTENSETDVTFTWGVVTRNTGGTNGRVTFPYENLVAQTNPDATQWTVDFRAPFKLKIREFGYGLISQTYTTTDLTLNAETAKDPLRIVSVAQTDDFVTGTIAQALAITGIAINFSTSTITLTENRTLQQIYNYWKAQFCQEANLAFTNQITWDGNRLALGNYSLVGSAFIQ